MSCKHTECFKCLCQLGGIVSLKPGVEGIEVIRERCRAAARNLDVFLETAVFTAAIVLRPCQADRSFPSVNFSSTLFLYFSLAVFMAYLTSLLTFFSDSEPVKKIFFFLIEDFLQFFCKPGLIVWEDGYCFGGDDVILTEMNVR